MMKRYSLIIFLLLFGLFVENTEAITLDNFAVSANTYSIYSDVESIVDDMFGVDYRLADWSDIVLYYNEGNDMQGFTDIIPGRTMVSYKGNRFWTSNRHYFINVSNHHTPGGFLVHAHIDNHLIDLGSWWNDRYILAFTPNPVPEPATMLLFGSGLVGLIGFGKKKKDRLKLS